MTDFVLNEQNVWGGNENKYLEIGLSVIRYTNFLKQPLKLEMFVPCDEGGNVVSDIITDDNYFGIHIYEKAKEKVLFEGFEIHILLDDDTKRLTSSNANFNPAWYNKEKGWYLSSGVGKMLVEDLIQYNLELTESALNQIYGTIETLST